MKRFYLSLIVGSALLAVAQLALAAGACYGCKIKTIGAGPYYDSICTTGTACAFIKMDQAVSTRPGCATNDGWDFVLDISTTSGRSTYALLLTASASGQVVMIGGTGGCLISAAGLVEDLRFFTASPQ